jgi:HTH-type transcriptional repressor of NAD biosynthesis genes
VFSSEVYGEPFAESLGAAHVSFDMERKQFPVSGSLIRQSPFRYWEYIPDVVRPYFVMKICFYGPESTGKSVMAERMAQIYQTEWVPEVARELITSNTFTVDDIIRIGYTHYERIQQKLKTANRILFCDTDAITTQIYSQKYLGKVPPVLFDLEKKVSYDKYFLFDIDVPWVADGLRDLGNEREEMFDLFKSELEKRSIVYQVVQGDFQQRDRFIREVVDKLLRLQGG